MLVFFSVCAVAPVCWCRRSVATNLYKMVLWKDRLFFFQWNACFFWTSVTCSAGAFEGDGDLEVSSAFLCPPPPLRPCLGRGQCAENPRDLSIRQGETCEAAGSIPSPQSPSSCGRRHLGCLAVPLCTSCCPSPSTTTPSPMAAPHSSRPLASSLVAAFTRINLSCGCNSGSAWIAVTCMPVQTCIHLYLWVWTLAGGYAV